MSYELSKAEPEVTISCHMFDNSIEFGKYLIPMEDMCYAMEYILTNTDLYKDDPRIKLVEKIKGSGITSGWNFKQDSKSRRIIL